MRLAVTGAAPITTQMIIAMRETLGFENVVTGYGLTEAHGIATMCRHDDDPETIAKTSGRAIPGVEVRLIDDDGKEVGIGEPGEVLVRGYNIMKGYLDNPEATAEAIDEDGWLHTGDIAVSDANGNLAITDRKKDMYIVGGFNAYPAEIERIITGHPSVAQVAVVGVPDDRLGEVGKAFVVPAAGDEGGRRRARRLVSREHGQLQGAALRRGGRRVAVERIGQGPEVRPPGALMTPRAPEGDWLGTPHLRFERHGSLAWCVIDRPDKRNAMTPAMYFGLRRAVDVVNRDPAARGSADHGHGRRVHPRR